jgi:hypothetical protein
MKKFINGFNIAAAILLATPAFSTDLQDPDQLSSPSLFKAQSVSRAQVGALLIE